MKKRLCKSLSLLLSMAISIFFIVQPVFAQSNTQTIYSHTETFEDNSYVVDEIQVLYPNYSSISPTATTKSKTAVRTYTYYDSLGKKCWSFSLTGTFQYNGSTSKATAASSSYTIYVTGWKCSSKSATYSGNTATGIAAFKYLTRTVNVKIGLKCSASGSISNINY